MAGDSVRSALVTLFILAMVLSPISTSEAARSTFRGFISLDCGLPTNSNYSEPTTGIDYISDAAFISTGVSKSIAPHQKQAAYVRSFPGGSRTVTE
ncbi:hypothetical protein ACE6H2_019380 [Prunus campanulata]